MEKIPVMKLHWNGLTKTLEKEVPVYCFRRLFHFEFSLALYLSPNKGNKCNHFNSGADLALKCR